MEERTITLANNSNGFLQQLNYPRDMPQNVDFVQHLIVPLGEVISLELHGVVLSAGHNCRDNYDYDSDPTADGYGDEDHTGDYMTVNRGSHRGEGGGNKAENLLEIYDNYADVNGTKWVLCAKRDHRQRIRNRLASSSRASASGQRLPLGVDDVVAGNYEDSPVFITSYLNTLHIRQRSSSSGLSLNQRDKAFTAPLLLNATIKVYEDKGYRPKLASKDVWVESCQPNPCQFGGKCVQTAEVKKCECRGHYSGRFCGLTICDFDPCLYGTCELTETSFKCNCLPGYLGNTCEQKKKLCDDNPCQGRGECLEKNNGFFCRLVGMEIFDYVHCHPQSSSPD